MSGTTESKTTDDRGLLYVREAEEDIPRCLSSLLGALLEARSLVLSTVHLGKDASGLS